jgi:hypothetical protein
MRLMRRKTRNTLSIRRTASAFSPLIDRNLRVLCVCASVRVCVEPNAQMQRKGAAKNAMRAMEHGS